MVDGRLNEHLFLQSLGGEARLALVPIEQFVSAR